MQTIEKIEHCRFRRTVEERIEKKKKTYFEDIQAAVFSYYFIGI